MLKLGNEQYEVLDELLKNKRIGLITNQTGVNSQMESTIDVFSSRYKLTALYAPEHGLYGVSQAGEAIGTSTDKRTKTTIFSLYGEKKEPTKDMLDPIDVLVFDIQDVGLRFYTYLYTMTLAMNAIDLQKKKFVVLDRPNPLGGDIIDGTLLKDEYSSFVGKYPVPHRYGLTVGEFAQWVKSKYISNLDLTIVPMSNWNRSMIWSDIGLPWIMPSPNLPRFSSLFYYSMSVVFEGTNVSEGRGTAKPFSLIGAPWIDGHKLAKELNKKKSSDHIVYRPAVFQPTFSKYYGEVCYGIEIHILNHIKMTNFTLAGYEVLYTIRDLWPSFFTFIKNTDDNIIKAAKGHAKGRSLYPFISLLSGSDDLIENVPLGQIAKKISSDKDSFIEEKTEYHLY